MSNFFSIVKANKIFKIPFTKGDLGKYSFLLISILSIRKGSYVGEICIFQFQYNQALQFLYPFLHTVLKCFHNFFNL